MQVGTRCRRGITSTDLLVCLAILLLASSFTFAQLARARETSNRIKCASNLKQLGMAILLYSNENRGAYPRTRALLPVKAGEMPAPVWGTPYQGNDDLIPPNDPQFITNPFVPDNPKDDAQKAALPFRPQYNDVTAALFLLMRTQDITSQSFVCPTTGLEKFEFGGGKRNALQWTNWPGNDALRKHLSYSYQNPYPSSDAIGKGFKLNNSISAEFAVASDMNPGGEALLKLTPQSPARQQREGNSFNHDRDGQNILYGDGHVEFFNNPFAGVQRDNIFTFGDSGKESPDKGGDGIIGSPVGPNDSILLPTARDIGQVDEKGGFVGAIQLAKPTAQQADAVRQKIVGEYQQILPNGADATLTVTRDQLIASSGPITITFTYTIDGLSGSDMQLSLAAPQTQGESARLKLEDSGDLTITRSPFFEGNWKRKK
ncbi:MAG TPA: hypothetical protein VGR35_17630 [Tepidisphaeraceae bacterium]|nr:hypothetical protein [Tepidisphaeraceae bacterium]